MSKKYSRQLSIAFVLLSFVVISGDAVLAQTAATSPATTQADKSQKQNRVIGEVTALDPAGQITVKTDAGSVVTMATDDKTVFRRLPSNESSLDKADKITFAGISASDRVVASVKAGADGKSVIARQLIVMSKSVAVQGRNDERRPGAGGRITAIDPAKKELTLMARSREGAAPVVVVASGNVKFLHLAPDSAKMSDAVPTSFAELKVGDQIRARGEMSADRKRLTAEEIVVGALSRVGGTVTAINAAANEITIKNGQTGKLVTVALGKRSTLRRMTPEVAAAFEQRRAQQQQQNAAAGGSAVAQTARGGAVNASGAGGGPGGGGAGRGGGGRGMQEIFESLPAIALTDLKQGDTVLVTGSASDDPARVTAMTILTGDAAFLNRLQQFQGPRQNRQMSPGMPGDVVGGGAGNRDQP